MCDQGHTILFNSTKCEIRKGVYGEIVATASRAPNDIYVLDEATKACLIAKEDDTIFGSNDDRLSKNFSTKVQSDFKMSLLGCKLSIDDSSKDVDQRLYMSMISSLLYVTTSRPNFMQEFGQVARFQAAPKESHIKYSPALEYLC